MKRRDFNKSLLAFFAAPAIPFRAFAAAPAAAGAIPPPNLYTWSTAIARTHGKCSAEMLKSMLHVDAAQASNLFSKLISNNVVGPANAVGLSQARSILPTPTGLSEALNPTGLRDHADRALDRAKALIEHDSPIIDAQDDSEAAPAIEDDQGDQPARLD